VLFELCCIIHNFLFLLKFCWNDFFSLFIRSGVFSQCYYLRFCYSLMSSMNIIVDSFLQTMIAQRVVGISVCFDPICLSLCYFCMFLVQNYVVI
jgi:hypothetical protein